MGLSAWGLDPIRPGRLRLGSALALYRRRMRRGRWVQDLLAVLGIAAGVALLYATQVASTSLAGPVARLNQGIVGAGQLQVVARGQTTIDQDTYTRIVRLPGVVRAAPVLEVSGNVVGRAGQSPVTFFGADPRIVKLRGSLLQGFDSADAARQRTVVIPEPVARHVGLRFGSDVRLQMDGRTVVVPAVVAGHEQIGGLVDTSIALMPLTYLQRLAGKSARVSRILVEARPDRVDEVRDELRALGPVGSDVRSTTYDTRLFKTAVMPTSAASTIFSVLSALVGWLFAICALLVTASDRRRLVMQQQRQGFPPGAILTTLLVDAAIIGVAGVLLGLGIGEVISRHGFRSDVAFLAGAFPVGDVRIVSAQSVAIAAFGGLAAAVIGVLAPVRDLAGATLPRGLTRTRRARAWSWAAPVGAVALAASLLITAAAPGAAVVGLVLLGLAVALLLGVILRSAIRALTRLNRVGRSSAALELALHQLRARRWRARGLAIATTGAIAVFGATSLQGARLNLQDGLTDMSKNLNAVSDIWVTAAGAGSSIASTPFAPRDAERLRAVPGVRAVDLYRASLLDVADRRVWIVGTPREERDPLPADQVLAGSAAGANRKLRGTGWATVSRAVADDLGVGVGDRLTLPTPKPLMVRVAAVTTNLGWSSGAVMLSAEDVRRAWRDDEIAGYHVLVAAGAPRAVVRDRVAQTLGRRSGLLTETATQRAQRQSAVARSGLSRLAQITVLTLLAAVLAIGAAMTGLLWQHRRTVAAHKVLGLTDGLLWRSLLVETGVLIGIGVGTGAAFGLVGQVLCTRGVEAVTGFPVIEQLRPATAAVTALVVLGASLLTVLSPGYLVARATPSPRE